MFLHTILFSGISTLFLASLLFLPQIVKIKKIYFLKFIDSGLLVSGCDLQNDMEIRFAAVNGKFMFKIYCMLNRLIFVAIMKKIQRACLAC